MGFFRTTGGTVTATPAIPSVSSQSIFAPVVRLSPGLAVKSVVRNDACTDCIVHVGSGGLVRTRVPSGAGQRTAYALLDIGDRARDGQVLVHDVIGFGRGDTPAQPVNLRPAARLPKACDLRACRPARPAALPDQPGGRTPLCPAPSADRRHGPQRRHSRRRRRCRREGERIGRGQRERGADSGGAEAQRCPYSGATIPRSRSDRLRRTAGWDRDQRDSRAGVRLHVLGAGSDCPRCAGRAVTTGAGAVAGESAPAARLSLPADHLGPRRRGQHSDRCPRELERRHRYLHLRMGAL